jgi:hypothetical protein
VVDRLVLETAQSSADVARRRQPIQGLEADVPEPVARLARSDRLGRRYPDGLNGGETNCLDGIDSST